VSRSRDVPAVSVGVRGSDARRVGYSGSRLYERVRRVHVLRRRLGDFGDVRNLHHVIA
jgi:hypothetical protein